MERLTVAQLCTLVPPGTVILIDSGQKGKEPVPANSHACLYKPLSGTVTLFSDDKLAQQGPKDR